MPIYILTMAHFKCPYIENICIIVLYMCVCMYYIVLPMLYIFYVWVVCMYVCMCYLCVCVCVCVCVFICMYCIPRLFMYVLYFVGKSTRILLEVRLFTRIPLEVPNLPNYPYVQKNTLYKVIIRSNLQALFTRLIYHNATIYLFWPIYSTFIFQNTS